MQATRAQLEVLLDAAGRDHAAAGATPYEDAMIEFHALLEKGPSV